MKGQWARQLVVTVSVEPDDPAVVGRTGSYRSLDGLEAFHALCRRYGVRPTYLLTHSAAGEPRCAELVRGCADEAEVGAHLHPEEAPPIAGNERAHHTLRASEVPPERLRAKVRNLLARVAEAAGRPPTSYRAGFFDLTPDQVAVLGELGVEADSSLGPLEKTREGYPYLRAPFAPYVLDPNDPCRPLNGSVPGSGPRVRTTPGEQSAIGNRQSAIQALVEVPTTSVFRRPFPRVLFGAYVRLPGPARGALRRLGLAELLRFRPAGASAEELVAVCERTEALGVPAVMSIHSNELWPGTCTSVRTEAERAAYLGRLEHVFAYAEAREWASRTLTEVARDVWRRSAVGSRQSADSGGPEAGDA